MGQTDAQAQTRFYDEIKDINFALVEGVRPPMYKGFKYWGKKPHNIWREYIRNYCAPGDIVLDPFAGSGVSALEAVQIDRRAVALDLNPMSSFIVDFLVGDFNSDTFKRSVTDIVRKVKTSMTQEKLYTTQCIICGTWSDVINYKWEDEKIYEIGYNCLQCKNDLLKEPTPWDHESANQILRQEINHWFPPNELPSTLVCTDAFRREVNNRYSDIWTTRNLHILAQIFSLIKATKDESTKRALLFAFTFSLHLTCKMNVPRRSSANRPFSTSWGRAALLIANRQMEMNPLVVFESRCLGRQGVLSVKASTQRLIGSSVNPAPSIEAFFADDTFNLFTGVADACDIDRFIPHQSADFVITDPPYGGLVQYQSLSTVWTCWLEDIDSRFRSVLDAEITMRTARDFESYHRKLGKAFRSINNVLKPDRTAVVTFHNDKVNVWNSMLRAAYTSRFDLERVIYQPNRRTGESNVANPFGTSANDFYLRFRNSAPENNSSQSSLVDRSSNTYKRVVIDAAKQVIVARGEPTDQTFLLNGIYPALAQHGYFLEQDLQSIVTVLKEEVGSTFHVYPESDKRLGGKWWLSSFSQNHPQVPLSDRVETAIIQILKREISATYDEVLAEIFRQFPNGLTPISRDIKPILDEYGLKDRRTKTWRIRDNYQQNESRHARYIGKLGSALGGHGFEIWVGHREQSDFFEGQPLRALVTADITKLEYDAHARERIGMIDLVAIKDNKVKIIVEVENSTSITSALERGSNIPEEIVRVIVLPDERLSFLSRKLDEPMFKHWYTKGRWHAKTYSEVDTLVTGLYAEDPHWTVALQRLASSD